ncbi:MAG: hypothetical protein DI539_21400 [Flavobacterium psychrophilum]|nr:MAG: hypothetical protein DI539_21400 [Flavobacterium psychrophilum]
MAKCDKEQFVTVPVNELVEIKKLLIVLIDHVRPSAPPAAVSADVTTGMIRPNAFMKATDIKRTKFNSLVANSQIKVVKKGRKVYIPITEVARYFSDPRIR